MRRQSVVLMVLILSLLMMAAYGRPSSAAICDVNNDSVIDRVDISQITAARNKPASALPGGDADGDGLITLLDARKCQLACTYPSCASNLRPVANAGPDQAEPVGSTMTLNGSGSSDPNGDPLTYAWSFASRPAGSSATLANPSSVNPHFTIDRPGSYTVQLIVNDGRLSSLADTVVVTTVNSPPVANAGSDQTTYVSNTVHLSGAGSTDADGDPLTYSWSLDSLPAGSAAALSNALAVNPSFTVDRPGDYVARLIVRDGKADSAPDTVTISTLNSKPIANAGPDKTAYVNQAVELDGSGSTDIDGNPLSFSWQFTALPAGSSAVLSDPTAVKPLFTLDRAGTYTVQLIVNDGSLNSNTDTVSISSLNSPPVANAGQNQSVAVGSMVQLSGGGSTDVDGNALTFNWSFTTIPAGSTASPSEPTAVNPTFVADKPGTYVAQLIVNDGTADSLPATVIISTFNSAPVANAGTPFTVPLGSVADLNGSASSDPDGDPLSYSWSFTSKPLGSGTVLSNPTAVNPGFLADRAGDYVAQLIVNDGHVNSPPATVTVSTRNSRPVADAGPGRTACLGSQVTLDGTASGDADGDPLSYSWALTSIPTYSHAVLAGATTSTPDFFADQPGSYLAQLIVSDGVLASIPATTTVTVNGNLPPVAQSGGPYSVDLGQGVTLDGTVSSEPDAACGDSIVSYEWTVGNAHLQFANQTAALSAADVAALGEGSHQVTLRVTDAFGATGTATTTLSIYDNRPVASFTSSSSQPACGQVVQFDASGSYHKRPDHSIVSYQWDFGDGTTGNGTIVSHAYTSYGSYTVTLTVTDSNIPPRTATTTTTVNTSAGNLPPLASPGGPYTVDLGQGVTLDGSTSSDPNAACGDQITSYQWTIGNSPFQSAAPTVVLSAAQVAAVGAGAHQVTLRVTDTFGSTGAATTTLTIYDNKPTALFSVTPSPAGLGNEVRFDATASYAGRPDRSIVGYQWNFGDGASGSGITTTHVYTQPGAYTVTLTVTDNNVPPKQATASVMLTVNEELVHPVANAGGPYIVDLGTGVTLDGSASYDPYAGIGDIIVDYTWFVGSFQFNSATPTLALSATNVNTLGAGTHPVTLRVSDTFGRTGTATTNLTIYDNQPVAAFTATPNPGACSQVVQFDAGASFHKRPDRSIVSYQWDFGDGTTGSGNVVSHAFTAFGSYPVRLIVTDNNNPPRTADTTTAVSISAGNLPPIASPGGTYTVDLGQAVTLNGSASSDPNVACGDAIVSFQWTIGTLHFQSATATLSAANITTLGAGTHQVTLMVTDTFGSTGTATTTLTIYNNQPVAAFTATPNPTACGRAVQFDASASFHRRPDRSLVSYQWGFGDGAAASGSVVSHAYGTYGSYTATLTVTDNNIPPKTATASVLVNVSQQNVAPVANAGGPYSADLGQGVALNGSGSSDPNASCGDSITYAWDLNNDGLFNDATGVAPSISAAQLQTLGINAAGPHTIRLRVTDSFGATNAATTTLTIYDNHPFAVIMANPLTAGCGLPVNFDGSGSYHGRPDRSIVSYEWDFDYDGSSFTADASAAQVSHTYLAAGPHSTALRVTDNNVPAKTAIATVSTTVNFANLAPVANAGGPYSAALLQTVTLNGTASSDPNAPCDSIVSYAWNIGNGAVMLVGATPSLTATQVNALGVGAHSVQLTVTDIFGATGVATTTLSIAGTELIVDNSDGTPFAVPTGTWSSSASMTGGLFIGLNFLVHQGSQGPATFTYRPEVTTTAPYDVYVRWTSSSSRCTDAVYTVNYNGGSFNSTANQRFSGGTWNLIGRFNFAAGTSGNVVLTPCTSSLLTTAADAVKFVLHP